jgi:hypothetical protein
MFRTFSAENYVKAEVMHNHTLKKTSMNAINGITCHYIFISSKINHFSKCPAPIVQKVSWFIAGG